MRHRTMISRELDSFSQVLALLPWFVPFPWDIFTLWQEIPKLSGFSAVRTGLTFANDLDHTKLWRCQDEIDVVRRLMTQTAERFGGIPASQKVRLVLTETRHFAVKCLPLCASSQARSAFPVRRADSEDESFATALSALLSLSPSPVGTRTLPRPARNSAR
jgi:hypothetical protein